MDLARTTLLQRQQLEHFKLEGLSENQVIKSRSLYGSNSIPDTSSNSLIDLLINLAKEPMVLILLTISLIYWFTDNVNDAIFLACATLIVVAISLYQNYRSKNALESLKKLSEPHCVVIRNKALLSITREDIVMDDLMIVEEGYLINADAIIVHSNDFSVDESILTGESFSVFKDKTSENNNVYSGSRVVSGLAVVKVTAIGKNTRLGEIGNVISNISESGSLLGSQISKLVKMMIFIGGIAFVFIWILNYLKTFSVLDSFVKALTLAMSVLPEEIPVALATFMAMGVWRLMKKKIIVKQMTTIESLGAASVLCLDKTGTLTENKMSLAKMFTLGSDKPIRLDSKPSAIQRKLINIAMWASEPIPYDPMDLALHDVYAKYSDQDARTEYTMIHEYPLDGKPPMMTHVYQNREGNEIIAAKGAPAAIIEISDLSEEEKLKIYEALGSMTEEGYRVLAVGEAENKDEVFPKFQQDFDFKFCGLVAFYDPPKTDLRPIFEAFDRAGIKLKILTGDNSETTRTIAAQAGFKKYDQLMGATELIDLPDKEIIESLKDTSILTRMYPEAKLKVIELLKESGEIVAMVGDGVNDGPALKSAHVGIAMGMRGSEVAKEAADIVLMNDDLNSIVEAIAMGRRIYVNLKKAIRYIISIHIPIILTVLMPLVFGWKYSSILLPVHVILLELIMGPTCSIIYENEPIESDLMDRSPRSRHSPLLNNRELLTSIVQGLMITLGAFISYTVVVSNGGSEGVTRAAVFCTLITANIFLTFVNRSFYFSIINTMRYKNILIPIIISFTIIILFLLLYVEPLMNLFHFEKLNPFYLITAILIGSVSVLWYEGVKWLKRGGYISGLTMP